jgi:regulator of cell morphogenesis and NO signaling
MNLDRKISLGEIVLAYPDTINVMNKYKIDYCCNGHEELEVALNRNLSVEAEIIEDLTAAMTKQKVSEVVDWKAKKPSELIDYILEQHHNYVKVVLSELNDLVFTILKVHFKDHSEQLLQVHYLVGTLKTELEAHLVKEEENLFPLIREFELSHNSEVKGKIFEFIESTESEHDAAGDLFKKLEQVTNNFNPPEGACASYKRTFQLIDALEKDTFNHIHLENSVLFKMIG